MTRSFVGETAPSAIKTDVEIERQAEIWKKLVEVVAPWAQVVNRDEHPSYLRGRFLPMHGVCQQGVAKAVAPLFRDGRPPDRRLAALSRVDWRISNPEWQGIAVQGRHISNTSTTVRNLAGLLSLKLGLDIDPGVAQTIETIFDSRGDKVPTKRRRSARPRPSPVGP
jgi:hypothetical protein